MTKTLIVAGNHSEFEECRRELGLSKRDAIYVTRYADLVGIDEADVKWVGRYHRNPVMGDGMAMTRLHELDKPSVTTGAADD